MKNFKSLSFLATFAVAFLLSSCAGITDANYSESANENFIEAQDLQDRGSDVREGTGDDPDMIRVRPE